MSSFLRKMHPVKTAQHVAVEAGIPATTIRKWLEQGCAPSGKHTAALARRYRGFLWAVFPDAENEWVAEIARQEELERLERQAEAAQRQIAELRAGRW